MAKLGPGGAVPKTPRANASIPSFRHNVRAAPEIDMVVVVTWVGMLTLSIGLFVGAAWLIKRLISG